MEAASIIEEADGRDARTRRAPRQLHRMWGSVAGGWAEHADVRRRARRGGHGDAARAGRARGRASACSSWPAARAASGWPRPRSSRPAARSCSRTSRPR